MLFVTVLDILLRELAKIWEQKSISGKKKETKKHQPSMPDKSISGWSRVWDFGVGLEPKSRHYWLCKACIFRGACIKINIAFLLYLITFMPLCKQIHFTVVFLFLSWSLLFGMCDLCTVALCKLTKGGLCVISVTSVLQWWHFQRKWNIYKLFAA